MELFATTKMAALPVALLPARTDGWPRPLPCGKNHVFPDGCAAAAGSGSELRGQDGGAVGSRRGDVNYRRNGALHRWRPSPGTALARRHPAEAVRTRSGRCAGCRALQEPAACDTWMGETRVCVPGPGRETSPLSPSPWHLLTPQLLGVPCAGDTRGGSPATCGDVSGPGQEETPREQPAGIHCTDIAYRQPPHGTRHGPRASTNNPIPPPSL